MRDHAKLRAFELADEVAMLVYRVEPKVIETEKVLNGLIRDLRDNSEPSAFSLQPKHLSSYYVSIRHELGGAFPEDSVLLSVFSRQPRIKQRVYQKPGKSPLAFFSSKM